MRSAVQSRKAVKCQLAADVLRSHGGVRLRVTGASMLPSAPPALRWPSGRGRGAGGDIVLFRREGRLFTHRVVRKVPGVECYWITRGDSLAQDDPPVSREELLGRVTDVIRGRRRIDPQAGAGWLGRVLRPAFQYWDLPARMLARVERMIGPPMNADRRKLLICVYRRSSAANPVFAPGVYWFQAIG